MACQSKPTSRLAKWNSRKSLLVLLLVVLVELLGMVSCASGTGADVNPLGVNQHEKKLAPQPKLQRERRQSVEQQVGSHDGTRPPICRLSDKNVVRDCVPDGRGKVSSVRRPNVVVGQQALHIVGVFQADKSMHQRPFSFPVTLYERTGSASVSFDLPGSNELVLSSYEPTNWTVAIGPIGSLDRIIAVGYFPQNVRVTGTGRSIPVLRFDRTELRRQDIYFCGFSFPDVGLLCDTNRLIADMEQITGLQMASFDGCYQASRFVFQVPSLPNCSSTSLPSPTVSTHTTPRANARTRPTSPSRVRCTSPQDCSHLAEKPVVLDCQGSPPSSYRSSGTSAATALHIVSVYETRSDHSFGYHPTGSAFVDFALPGANVLVLSSYEPTHWTVSMARGASLEKIITIGYHHQTVTILGSSTNVPVQPSKSRECGYSLPYLGGGCDTNTLIYAILQETGLRLASFDGCYRATRFKLHPNCSRSIKASTSSATQNTQSTPIQATTDAYPKPSVNAGVGPTSSSSGTSPMHCSRLAEKPVVLDCQGSSPSSYRSSGTSAATALHIVSVYETRSDHSFGYHPTGSAFVDFALPGANVLVLSSYEPTHWTISMARGASLEKIITIGYHQQTVTLLGSSTNVPVQPSKSRECGYSLPYRGGGCDTNILISAIQEETGLPLASFDGCYRATRFKLHPHCSLSLRPSTSSTAQQPRPFSTTAGAYVTTPAPACSRLALSPVVKNCAVTSGCGPSSFRAQYVPESTALHVVSVYETRSDHSFQRNPTGLAAIDFRLPGSNALALSSYGPTHWMVIVQKGGLLRKVIVFGHYKQTVQLIGVQGRPAVQVQHYTATSYPQQICGANILPHNLTCKSGNCRGTCSLSRLKADLRRITGLEMSSFDGCYRATWFKFDQNTTQQCRHATPSATTPSTSFRALPTATTSDWTAGGKSTTASNTIESCCQLPDKPVILDCGGDSAKSYMAENMTGTALHIVEVHVTSSGRNGYSNLLSRTPRFAHVSFSLPGSNVLVLSSVYPIGGTMWIVSVVGKGSLDKVIVVGQYKQSVQVLGSSTTVKVQWLHPSELGRPRPGGFSPAHSTDECSKYNCNLAFAIENITGLELTTYSGCYRASRFSFRQTSPTLCPDPSPVHTTSSWVEYFETTAPTLLESNETCSQLADEPVIRDCTTSSGSWAKRTSFRAENSTGPTVHVVGIYSANLPSSPRSRRSADMYWLTKFYDQLYRYLQGLIDTMPQPVPTRPPPRREREAHATVNFQLPGSNTLVLSAYHPTSWTVEVTEGGRLDKIITVGYYNQTVRVVGSQTQVEVEQFDVTRRWGTVHPCGYIFPHTSGYCNAGELIADIENITGQDVASYDGCYAASQFVFQQTKPTACPQLNDSDSYQEEPSLSVPDDESSADGTADSTEKTPQAHSVTSTPAPICSRLAKRPVIRDCETSATHKVRIRGSGSVNGTALHMVSIYDSRRSLDQEKGTAFVDFHLPGSNVLVLSSFVPTVWYVTIWDGGLDKVVSFGYHQQRVHIVDLGATHMPQIHYYGHQNRSSKERVCGSSVLPSDLASAACDLNSLFSAMTTITGLHYKLESFYSCYRATTFEFKPRSAANCYESPSPTPPKRLRRSTTSRTVTLTSTAAPQCNRLAKKPVILDCATSSGYKVSSFLSNITMGTALHVVSIYESRSSWSHLRGRADIDFQLPGSNVLVISSYEPTDWYIQMSETASLDKIVSFGYYQQRFFFPNLSSARKPVIRLYGYQNHQSTERVCGSSTLRRNLETEGCGLNRLNAAMKAITGLKMSSFHGCYRATKFRFQPQPASFCPNVAMGTGSNQEDRHTTTLAVTTRLHARTLPQSAETEKCDRWLKGPVILDCATSSGYTVSSYRSNITMGTALHVVSIYESRSSWSHERGRADIDFQLPGSNVLVISSYEPTDWYIQMSETASLDKIVSFGYYQQRFFFLNLSPARKPVIRPYGYQNHQSTERVCGSSTLRRNLETEGCGLNHLNAAMKAITGLKMTSFHGCYRATKFRFQPQPASFCPNVATGTGSNQEDRHTTTLAATTWLHTRTLPQSAETEKCDLRLKGPVILDCATSSGYTVSSYRSNITMGTALHIVSIYESRSSWSHLRGRADIDFQLPGSNVLVISSYEPTDWYIQINETASLDKIVSFGYHQQRIFFRKVSTGLRPIVHRYGYQNYAYQNHSRIVRVCQSSTLPFNLARATCNLDRLNMAMKLLTGHRVSSFDGCYRATRFEFRPQSGNSDMCQNSPTTPTSRPAISPETANPMPTPKPPKVCANLVKAPVIRDCTAEDGEPTTSYRSDETTGTALHAVSIYESRASPFLNRGRVDVDFRLPGSNILFLSSSTGPTDWYVKIHDGGSLQKIFSFGYRQQIVRVFNVNSTAPIPLIRRLGRQNRSSDADVCHKPELPTSLRKRSCDFNTVNIAMRRITGHDISTFHGCFQATKVDFKPLSSDTCRNSSLPTLFPTPDQGTPPKTVDQTPDPNTTCNLARKPVIRDCMPVGGIPVSSYRAANSTGTALHVVSIYESRSSLSRARGRAEVDFQLPGRHILFLSSKERTDWYVKIRGGGSLQKIISFSHFTHTVRVLNVNSTTPAPVVRTYSYPYHRFYEVDVCGGRALPFNLESPHIPACDLNTMNADLKKISGHEMSTFDGCYRARKFEFKPQAPSTCQGYTVSPEPPRPPATSSTIDTPPQPAEMCGRLPKTPVITDCATSSGYKLTSFRSVNVTGTALHIAAIHETQPLWSLKQGRADVDFQLPGKNILVLSSFKPTDWFVRISEGGSLQEILSFGYHPQTIQVVNANPALAVPVIRRYGVQNRSSDIRVCFSFSSLPTNLEEKYCDFNKLNANMEKLTGHSISSFDGCFWATKFEFKPNFSETCKNAPTSRLPSTSTPSISNGLVHPAAQCGRLAKRPAILDCSAGFSFRATDVPEIAVHVLSVYATAYGSHLQGNVIGTPYIDFNLPGLNVLILSSQKATNWSIHVKPGASLHKVVTFGVNRQVVHTTGLLPENFQVHHLGRQAGRNRAQICESSVLPRTFGNTGQFCTFERMSDELERLIGAKVSSFDSCLFATQIKFERNTSSPCEDEAGSSHPTAALSTTDLPRQKTTSDTIPNEQSGSRCRPLARQPISRDAICLHASSFRAKKVRSTALHIIRISRSMGSRDPSGGESLSALVAFRLPGPNVLVLSSFVTTNWTVNIRANGSLSRILTVGYHKQNVQIKNSKSAIPVQHVLVSDAELALPTRTACPASSSFGHDFGCEINRIIAEAEKASGLKTSSFDSCTTELESGSTTRFRMRPEACLE